MSVNAREMLERLRAEQGGGGGGGETTARAELERLRAAKSQQQPQSQGGGALQWAARNIAEPFNRGVVDFVNLPASLLEGVTGADLGTSALRDVSERAGFTAPEEQRATGVIPRSAEILGGSVLPTAGLMRHGAHVAQAVPEASRSILGRLAAGAAQSPKAAVGGEVVGALGAGFGGEVASKFSDDPSTQAIGELAGGLAPAAFAMGPVARGVKALPGAVKKAAAPFRRSQDEVRAAKRLQSLTADPHAAADAIDPTSDLSPARQTGDPRLIALERTVNESDPARMAAAEANLGSFREQAQGQLHGAFGGDVSRPRDLLQQSTQSLVRRAQQIGEDAHKAAFGARDAIDPGVDSRRLAVAAREKVDAHYERARQEESALWESLDHKAPGAPENARTRLQDELAKRSPYDDPSEIPAWLRRALGVEGGDGIDVPDWVNQLPAAQRESVLAQLQTPDDVKPATTLGDLQAIRKRVGREIREERGATAPNYNKIRILEGVRAELLKDMSAVDTPGVEKAIGFSREFNTQFTQGALGRLRSFDRRGARRVDPADTLNYITSGQAPARNVAQLLDAAPDVKPEVEQFLKAEFLQAAATPDGVSPAAANRFLSRWKARGVLEQFPGLEDELRNVVNLQEGARRLGLRAEQVRDITRSSARSRAAVYLNAPPGQEMDAVLSARHPHAVARSLVRRMQGDATAIQGLKQQFADTLMSQASSGYDDAGNAVVSGARLWRLAHDHRGTARALGMTDQEFSRLTHIASRLKLAEQKAAKLDTIIDDTPATFLDLIARWAGAQSGQRAGSGMGSSLVLAQAGSERARAALQRLMRDGAKDMLIEAQTDPKKYRALLTKPTDSPKRKREAERTLHAWAFGVAGDWATEEGE